MLSFKALKNILTKVQGLVEHDSHFHFCVKVTLFYVVSGLLVVAESHTKRSQSLYGTYQ